jgi:hypothetical protein
LSCGNSTRCLVRCRLSDSQHGKLQCVEPVVCNRIARLAHQALPLPRQAQPESAIVVFRSPQADGANQARRIALEPQRPVPFFSASDRRKRYIAAIDQRPLRWIRPRHSASQKLHQFPVWEKYLNLLCIGEFERSQPQPLGFECRRQARNLRVLPRRMRIRKSHRFIELGDAPSPWWFRNSLDQQGQPCTEGFRTAQRTPKVAAASGVGLGATLTEK